MLLESGALGQILACAIANPQNEALAENVLEILAAVAQHGMCVHASR